MTAALKGVVWSDVGAAIVDGICSIKWKDLLLSFGDLFEELSYSLAELLIGILDEVFGTHLIDKWQEFEAESRARSKESKEAFMTPDYTPSDDLQENLETLAEMVNNADATTKELNKMIQAINEWLILHSKQNGLLRNQEATEKPVWLVRGLFCQTFNQNRKGVAGILRRHKKQGDFSPCLLKRPTCFQCFIL